MIEVDLAPFVPSEELIEVPNPAMEALFPLEGMGVTVQR